MRDVVIKQITYGISSDLKTISTTNTAGTIDFSYLAPFADGNWATAYDYSKNDPCSNPPAPPQARCDDPVQKSGGFTAPSVMGTFTLVGITSYLNLDNSSNAAFGYNFSYGDPGYCAGEHLLEQIQPLVYQNGTAHQLPVVTFGYTQLTDTYYDSMDQNQKGQQFQNTTRWSYLNSYQDLNAGIGASVIYQRAYNNSDGTPTIKNQHGDITDNRYDALYCTWNVSDCSSGSYSGHYAHPDDLAWSVQVVQQLISSGSDSSSLTPATTS
ncbi:MAG TPA: hypothetical protein VFA09_19610 [Ktedonobacteraceae bacterium]|nr:hypothetical protein [Ktedonobacteraceae bacterium]